MLKFAHPSFYCSVFFLCPPAGRVRTRRQSSETAAVGGASVTDSRGRSRAKAVSQSQREFAVTSSCPALANKVDQDL